VLFYFTGLARVYTFGPTFRADNAVDRTHLAEFYMVEVELAFIDKLSELLDLMEDFTKKVGSKILNETSIDIDVLHTGEWNHSKQVTKHLG